MPVDEWGDYLAEINREEEARREAEEREAEAERQRLIREEEAERSRALDADLREMGHEVQSIQADVDEFFAPPILPGLGSGRFGVSMSGGLGGFEDFNAGYGPEDIQITANPETWRTAQPEPLPSLEPEPPAIIPDDEYERTAPSSLYVSPPESFAPPPAPVNRPVEDRGFGPNVPSVGQFSPFDDVFRRHAGEYGNDPQFMAILAAGAYAESGWNPRAVGDGGHSIGIFQMHDRGAGAGLSVEQRQDPNVQAQHMIPRYIDGYNRYRNQYQGAQLASMVAAYAERPLGWDNPNSAAHNGYRNAFNYVLGQSGSPRQQYGTATGNPGDTLTLNTAPAYADPDNPLGSSSYDQETTVASDWVQGDEAADAFTNYWQARLAELDGYTSRTPSPSLAALDALSTKYAGANLPIVAQRDRGSDDLADSVVIPSVWDTEPSAPASTPPRQRVPDEFIIDQQQPIWERSDVAVPPPAPLSVSERAAQIPMNQRQIPSAEPQGPGLPAYLGERVSDAANFLGSQRIPLTPAGTSGPSLTLGDTLGALGEFQSGPGAGPVAGAVRGALGEQVIADETSRLYHAFLNALEAYGPDDPRTLALEEAYNAALGQARVGGEGTLNRIGDRTGFGAAERAPEFGAVDLAAQVVPAVAAGAIAPRAGVGLARNAVAMALSPGNQLTDPFLAASALGRGAGVANPLADAVEPVMAANRARMADAPASEAVRIAQENEVLERVLQRALPAASTPEFATDIGGAALGAGLSQIGTDENTSIQERLARVAGGAAAGFGGAHLGRAAIGRLGTQADEAADILTDSPPVRARGEGAIPTDLPLGAKPITLTRDEEIERLRLDKFPGWLQDEIATTAESENFGRARRRGVLPEEVQEQMADALGRTVDQWRATPLGRALNTEETRALLNSITGRADQLVEYRAKFAAAREAGEAISDVDIAGHIKVAKEMAELVNVAEGARAEWGRAGQAWQALHRADITDPNMAKNRIIEALGGTDNALRAIEEFGQMIENGASPAAMARFWSDIEKGPLTAADWIVGIRYNSMLSSTRTLVVNALGTASEIPWRLLRDTAASVAKGDPRLMMGEIQGMNEGLKRGLAAALDQWHYGVTSQELQTGAKLHVPPRRLSDVKNPVGKVLGTGIELVGRAASTSDAFLKQVAYGMVLGRDAGLAARKEGHTGQAWAEAWQKHFDNPTGRDILRANAAADRLVFHGQMGAGGEWLAQGQKYRVAGAPVGQLALPFLRTIYHIMARGVDRTPVGFLTTAQEVARGKYGSVGDVLRGKVTNPEPGSPLPPLGERLGDNVIGSMLAAYFYYQAHQGNVSGAGPDEKNARAQLEDSGWQRYSFKVGDTWISYANWGPVAVALAGAASIAEAEKYKKADATTMDQVGDTMRRFVELTTEQSYLQQVGHIFKVLNGDSPDRLATSFVTSFVPFGSALNTIGQSQDPFRRKPEGLGEALQYRSPFMDTVDIGDVGGVAGAALGGPLGGLVGREIGGRIGDVPTGPLSRENVPVDLDVFGNPLPSASTGPTAFLPVRKQTAGASETADLSAELGRLGLTPGEVTKRVGGEDLDRDRLFDYQKLAGEKLETGLRSLFASPTYEKAPNDDFRRRAVEQVINDTRRDTRDELELARNREPDQPWKWQRFGEPVESLAEELRITRAWEAYNNRRATPEDRAMIRGTRTTRLYDRWVEDKARASGDVRKIIREPVGPRR